MRSCETCNDISEVKTVEIGGFRYSEKYHSGRMDLCATCRAVLKQLLTSGTLKFRDGPKDTTNSRQSKIKAAIKRERFGNPNINRNKIWTGVKTEVKTAEQLSEEL